jgi:amino acid transporter
MVVPAVALGAFVVFCIGYSLTYFLVEGIGRIIERRKRKRSGLIPPVDQTTFDINAISIVGGAMAVVLVLILLVAVPSVSKAVFWYVLTGIGIIFGLLTFVLFRSKTGPIEPRKTPPEPIHLQPPKPQRIKSDDNQDPVFMKYEFYRRLLLLTRNDRDLADRLIELERKRKPGTSEAELIKNAIERWELDNR